MNIVLDCSRPLNLVHIIQSGQVKFETLNNFLFQRILFFVHKHLRYSICKTKMQNYHCLLPSFIALSFFVFVLQFCFCFASSRQQNTQFVLCECLLYYYCIFSNGELFIQRIKRGENLLRWCLFALMPLFTLKWYKCI